MSSALAIALRSAADAQRSIRANPHRVARAREERAIAQLGDGISRRAGGASTGSVFVLRPVPEDAVEIHEFVMQQFDPRARRLAR